MSEMHRHLQMTLAALALEACLGYPAALHRLLPHPVVWLGRAIGALEARWNRIDSSDTTRRALGVVTVALIVAGVERIGGRSIWGFAPATLVATTGLAQKSLYQHVAAVDHALADPDISVARRAVGQIVGRDTAILDRAGIAAAGLESLGESFNDGIVAPAFWLAVLGLPGLFAYKAVNTADSMIGHWEPRWRAFGWAAARVDDVLNLLPARLAGVLIIVAGGAGGRVMVRDAPKHASPNAGWPEAAMAGALGVRLGGPVSYDGVMKHRPDFGDGREAGPADLRRGLRLYVRSCALLWLLVALGGFAWPR